jgi:hypothetical protein
MGYSCAAKASLVFNAISELIGAEASNAMPDGGFYERSNVEHDDGSITGSVFKRVRVLTDAERAERAAAMGPNAKPEWVGDPCRRAGVFKISGDGKIVRFPGLTKALRTAAEQKGAALFATRYPGFA